MMGKRKVLTPEILLEKETESCINAYERWNHLYTYGGSDPVWEDGYGLNLIRNHIQYHKKNIKEICETIGYMLPEVYHRKLPELVDNYYMVNKDEIHTQATKTLKLMELYQDYIELLTYQEKLSEKQQTQISLNYVIGHVMRLRKAIKEYDYLVMRRYKNTEHYLEDFSKCLHIAKTLENTNIQT